MIKEQTILKASELRIGNWISETIGWWGNGGLEGSYPMNIQVKPQNINELISDPYLDAEKTILRFHPIPLTPEILEKAGFEKKPVSQGYVPYVNGRFYYNETTSEIEIDDNVRVKVEYLHQFQNLYHAIIGEELEINL